MPYILFIFQTGFVIFLGFALGFSFSAIFRKIFKKTKASFQSVLAIFSLAFMIVSATGVFLVIGNFHHCLPAFLEEKNFFLVALISAVLFSMFIKFLLIPIAVIYFSLFFYTRNLLNQNCIPLNQPVLVRADDSSGVNLTVITLPKRLLLPVPRKWISLKSVEALDEKSVVERYRNWVLSDGKVHKIEFPKDVLYPSVFRIETVEVEGTLEVSVVRSL